MTDEELKAVVQMYRKSVLEAMKDCGYKAESINIPTICMALSMTRSKSKIYSLVQNVKNFYVFVDRLNGRKDK